MIPRPRILIIEDDSDYQKLLVEHLGRDFLLLVASNGQDGIARMHSMHPELVILGLSLRSGDGIHSLKGIVSNLNQEIRRLLILSRHPITPGDLRCSQIREIAQLPKDNTMWRQLIPRLRAMLAEVRMNSDGEILPREPGSLSS